MSEASRPALFWSCCSKPVIVSPNPKSKQLIKASYKLVQCLKLLVVGLPLNAVPFSCIWMTRFSLHCNNGNIWLMINPITDEGSGSFITTGMTRCSGVGDEWNTPHPTARYSIHLLASYSCTQNGKQIIDSLAENKTKGVQKLYCYHSHSTWLQLQAGDNHAPHHSSRSFSVVVSCKSLGSHPIHLPLCWKNVLISKSGFLKMGSSFLLGVFFD